MRHLIQIAVLSDLHLNIRKGELLNSGLSDAEATAELEPLYREALDEARTADILVLDGDVCEGTLGISWAAETFPRIPVVYVAGNHEFYEHDYWELLNQLHETAARTDNVRFLENRATEFNLHGQSLRMLGCTLWTDYELYGVERMSEAMQEAGFRISDHQWIKYRGETFWPEHALDLHRQSRNWLTRELAKSFAGTTVVVTHHAPSRISITPQLEGDLLSPAFASDLTALISEYQPPLWIHGHTHHNVDYHVGATRVISNQWGYPEEGLPLMTKIVTV